MGGLLSAFPPPKANWEFVPDEVLAEAVHRSVASLPAPRKRPAAVTRIALLDFGVRYFPHHCTLPVGSMHRELSAELDRLLAADESQRLAIAAPRGNAKSTWVSLIFPLYCIVYQLKHFIVLVSDTGAQASSLLSDVKAELEDNDVLAADFPDTCRTGPIWRDDAILTNNGVFVLALGTGQRIRGRKRRQYRPDLVILDDIENDQHVRNLEQRNRVYQWLTKAVLKTRGPASKCDVIFVGTILHFDSVLSRVLDRTKSPGWHGRKYKAVIRWAERQDLWAEWQRLYTDFSRPDPEREAAAEEFFERHRDEMLRGAEVLWPEAEPYYELMRLRIDEGPASFDSEKQNEPINPDDCLFREEWFQWFVEIQTDGETYLVPEHGERVKLSDCDIYGACDPSMGKLNKHSDPSAIVSIAAYPSKRLAAYEEGGYQSYWIIDADVRKRHPHEIMRDILTLHRERRYRRFGIERVQFQELFADNVQAAALGQEGLQDLQIKKLNPLGDKGLRIEKLQPLIYSGRLKWSRKAVVAYNQTRYYPQADHDDGPDAIEMALEVIGAIGWRMVDVEPEGEAMPTKKHAFIEQIQEKLPEAFRRPDRSRVCGNCAHFELESGRSGRCRYHSSQAVTCRVSVDALECEMWQAQDTGA